MSPFSFRSAYRATRSLGNALFLEPSQFVANGIAGAVQELPDFSRTSAFSEGFKFFDFLGRPRFLLHWVKSPFPFCSAFIIPLGETQFFSTNGSFSLNVFSSRS